MDKIDLFGKTKWPQTTKNQATKDVIQYNPTNNHVVLSKKLKPFPKTSSFVFPISDQTNNHLEPRQSIIERVNEEWKKEEEKIKNMGKNILKNQTKTNRSRQSINKGKLGTGQPNSYMLSLDAIKALSSDMLHYNSSVFHPPSVIINKLESDKEAQIIQMNLRKNMTTTHLNNPNNKFW